MKYFQQLPNKLLPKSPPVWGAWVEMVLAVAATAATVVAPRVGGVG